MTAKQQRLVQATATGSDMPSALGLVVNIVDRSFSGRKKQRRYCVNALRTAQLSATIIGVSSLA